MVDVYRHTFCNISAVGASSNPTVDGLFRERLCLPRLLYPFKANLRVEKQYWNSKDDDGPWMIWNDSNWVDEVEEAPLSTRGWVVQERFLAPRILHFAKNQIYWECLEAIRCTSDPVGSLWTLGSDQRDISTATGSMKTTLYKDAGSKLARIGADLREDGRSFSDPNQGAMYGDYKNYHEHWGDVVSIYVACNLTKESDRSIAMSGIAKTFQKVNGDDYLAGLWKRMIYTDLGWKSRASKGIQAHLSESYAPSWSWMSIVGGQVQLRIPRGRYGGTLPRSLIKLVEARIIPLFPGGDLTGLLHSAELDIKCLLYYWRWEGESDPQQERKLHIYRDEGRTDLSFETSDIYLDTTALVERFSESLEITGVCVPINGVYGGYGGGSNDYLVLEHEIGVRYRRIGMVNGGSIGNWVGGFSGDGSLITLV